MVASLQSIDAHGFVVLGADHQLSDSVAQPALSPDGRMLAFVRGEGTFATVGQVYLKRLPDGEPTPLTSDGLPRWTPCSRRMATAWLIRR